MYSLTKVLGRVYMGLDMYKFRTSVGRYIYPTLRGLMTSKSGVN